MILSAQSIRDRGIISCMAERGTLQGVSHGLGPASYDVRTDRTVLLGPRQYTLTSTIEHFTMPHDVAARVYSKSTHARNGVLVWNTFIDPGFIGHLTIGLFNHSNDWIAIRAGKGIAQVVFEQLDQATEAPYAGKYQNQGAAPVGAIFEEAA